MLGVTLTAQRPLSRGKGAWRGAKLWLGWEQSRPAWRFARGRYQPAPSVSSGNAALSGLNGEAAAVVLIGYALYMPVGGTVGALSGAIGVPSKAKVEQAMGVMSNTVAKADLQQAIAQSLLAEFQRRERGMLMHPELVTSDERPERISAVEIKIHAIRLEGGVGPNPTLWLSVEWSAQLYSADAPEVVYSTGGVWQSNKQLVFQKWADGADLEESLREACRQIAAVIAEQFG